MFFRNCQENSNILFTYWLSSVIINMNNAKDFDFSWTPEFVYFLGFLWGDGWLYHSKPFNYNISIEIVKDDLDEILPTLRTISDWTVSYRHRDGRRETGTATLSRKVLFDWLGLHNYRSKNLDAKIVNKIPEELKGYWLRGLIDADGCFQFKDQSECKYTGKDYKSCSLSIYGPIDQDWTSIIGIFNLIGVKTTIKKRVRATGSSSEIILSRRRDLILLNDFVYSGKDLGLKRKKKIMEEIVAYDKKMAKFNICST